LIDAGGNPQLSAFWRRRLTMLVPTSQTSPALSRRNMLWLGAAATLLLVLPTFRPDAVTADEPAGGSVQSDKNAKVPKGGGTSATPTVSGVVVDEEKHPVPEADVRIYETNRRRQSERLLQRTFTDANGRFRLDRPTTHDPRAYAERFKLTVSKKGFASRVTGSYAPLPPLFSDLVLWKPESLRGRVTGPEGQPVAGADVWTLSIEEPIAGIESAKTDANGYFEVPDLKAWKDDGMPMFTAPLTAKHLAEATARAKPGTGKLLLRVWHPDYGKKLGPYSQIPDTVNVTFDKPAIVIGRVVDPSTGKPLRGILVSLGNVAKLANAHTITDDRGAFRLLLQGSGVCTLVFETERWRSPERRVETVSGSQLDLSEIKLAPGDSPRPPAPSPPT